MSKGKLLILKNLILSHNDFISHLLQDVSNVVCKGVGVGAGAVREGGVDGGKIHLLQICLFGALC